jgi:hypothetical protein
MPDTPQSLKNVASLDLCKELYELSGWGDTDQIWVKRIRSSYRNGAPFYQWTVSRENRSYRMRQADRHPAYSLGYLLRKLPGYVGDEFLDMCWYGDGWECAYQRSRRGLWNAEIGSHHAKTPEDAACKLAIELFKQGVLTP